MVQQRARWREEGKILLIFAPWAAVHLPKGIRWDPSPAGSCINTFPAASQGPERCIPHRDALKILFPSGDAKKPLQSHPTMWARNGLTASALSFHPPLTFFKDIFMLPRAYEQPPSCAGNLHWKTILGWKLPPGNNISQTHILIMGGNHQFLLILIFKSLVSARRSCEWL